MEDIANAVSQIVRWIINLAPFGIMGLVYTNVATNGLAIFKDYGRLLLLLVGCMLATALIVDPLIAAVVLRRNPYPLVFRCLKESVETALNSSGDVMFAATAEYAQWQKQGKPLPRFLGGTLETRT